MSDDLTAPPAWLVAAAESAAACERESGQPVTVESVANATELSISEHFDVLHWALTVAARAALAGEDH